MERVYNFAAGPATIDQSVLEKARTIGETMPEWPAEGSVSLQDGYVLVNL